ncbi:MAG: GNAT family N-acetyltransferase [Sphingobacteriales bacterium JAD_PAG50586_3]|nr:MAG: GNAT family N-acetyltransferase [Sphingobacteriales bacterium JAD_PAG50586_3]
MSPTVSLRPLQITDAEAIARMGNNPLIAGFMRDVFPHPYTLENAIAFINNVKDTTPTRVFAIVANGEHVGCCGIFPKDDVYRMNAEVGYWLGQEYWGKGIATQATKLLAEYGFDTLGMNRIYASVFAPNKASGRVLEKAGFVYEGTQRQSVYKNGEYLDELFYSLLRKG